MQKQAAASARLPRCPARLDGRLFSASAQAAEVAALGDYVKVWPEAPQLLFSSYMLSVQLTIAHLDCHMHVYSLVATSHHAVQQGIHRK